MRDSPYIYIEGKEHFLQDTALAILLLNDVVECINMDDGGITLGVNTNDIFYFGCGDDEYLKYDQLKPLYKEWERDKKFGYLKWLCKQRNLQPLQSLKQEMVENGSWDEELEKLGKTHD